MKRKFLFSIILGLSLLAMMVPVTAANGSGMWSPEYTTQTHLAGSDIASTYGQFVEPLPVLSISGGTIQTVVAGTSQIEFELQEFKANMLPHTFAPASGGSYNGTWVWGYVTPGTVTPQNVNTPRDTYTGGVVVAVRGTPTEFKFTNKLGTASSTHLLAYKYAIDQSLHWANPGGAMKYMASPFDPAIPAWLGNPQHYLGAIPAAVHLHGAEDPAAIDGGPDSWFTSTGQHGAAFYSKDGNINGNYCIYRYPNVQEAAPLWFHDHTLGATRLNVYMGLAGAYALIDPNLNLPTGLNPVGLNNGTVNLSAYGLGTNVEPLVPLVIQDRMFDTNGQLFYNSGPPPTTSDPQNYAINPEHPYWTPEFFGDTIAVNGKVWPYLSVQAKRYRFFMINGSNARSYILSFKDSLDVAPGYTAGNTNSVTPTIWQIGTDQGYLDKPVAVDPLIIMPGERAEFIIDFHNAAGQNLVLNNFGPDVPLSDLPVPDTDFNAPTTTGTVMQFRVGSTVTDNSFNPAAAGATIRTGNQEIVRLVNPANGTLASGVKPNLTRELTLVEIARDLPAGQDYLTVGGLNFEGGPLEVLVNNTKWMGLRPNESDPNEMQLGMLKPVNGAIPDGIGNWLTEMPAEGTTEIWEIVNTTMDAHPIHTHLAQFQLLNRQAVNMGDMGAPAAGTYAAAYSAAFPGGNFIPAYGPPLQYGPTKAAGGKYGGNPDIDPFLMGELAPPNDNEAGWKDTVMVPPGMVTRFVIRWAPTDLPVNAKPNDLHYAFLPNDHIPGNPSAIFDYVWHCHIVDHEDNEMMRPDRVTPRLGIGARDFVMGRDY